MMEVATPAQPHASSSQTMACSRCVRPTPPYSGGMAMLSRPSSKAAAMRSLRELGGLVVVRGLGAHHFAGVLARGVLQGALVIR